VSPSTVWIVVIGAAVGTYLLKLAGLSVPPALLKRPLIGRCVELIPAALLVAGGVGALGYVVAG